MGNYIDGFVLPVPRAQLDAYREVVTAVAQTWKEHGAIDYAEYVGDDLAPEGLRSFTDSANARDDEVVIFGWVSFESREARDTANEKVAADARVQDLVDPLTRTQPPAFDARRMCFGGFRALVPAST